MVVKSGSLPHVCPIRPTNDDQAGGTTTNQSCRARNHTLVKWLVRPRISRTVPTTGIPGCSFGTSKKSHNGLLGHSSARVLPPPPRLMPIFKSFSDSYDALIFERVWPSSRKSPKTVQQLVEFSSWFEKSSWNSRGK